MIEKSRLPDRWEWVSLGDFGRWYGGGTPNKSNGDFWAERGIPWISPKDMKEFRLANSEDHVTELALAESSIQLFPADTVLIVVRSGILARTLPVAIALVSATMNQDIKGVRPYAEFDAAYLAYYLRSAEHDILKECSKHGTTVASIETDALKRHPVPVAPSSEQRRIVAKIEELFSDLDAGVAALERARANLKRYRASVLKSAVEGKLTAEWRAAHPDVEPASALLERILKERRSRWEAEQLAEFERKGKTPPKNWQEKYKEPAAPDTEGLPELPEGWCWATVDMLGTVVGGITKGQRRKEGQVFREVPYLRVANVQRGYLDLSEIKMIQATTDEIDDLTLVRGDILFNEGGDRDKLGRGWVWNGEIDECIHQNHVFRLRLFCSDVRPEFVSHHGNTFGKGWFLRVGKQSVNLASINMTVLRSFPVPIPPAAEQAVIVHELEDQLSILDHVDETITNELFRAARLRQSILKRAFEGKLVPQDPSDEPASVLLERIRAGREEANGNGTAGKARRGGKRQTELSFEE